MSSIGAPELLIITMVGIVPLAIVIWALVDALSRPDWAWQAAMVRPQLVQHARGGVPAPPPYPSQDG
jgi:hypothetical protein